MIRTVRDEDFAQIRKDGFDVEHYSFLRWTNPCSERARLQPRRPAVRKNSDEVDVCAVCGFIHEAPAFARDERVHSTIHREV